MTKIEAFNEATKSANKTGQKYCVHVKDDACYFVTPQIQTPESKTTFNDSKPVAIIGPQMKVKYYV